MGWNKPGEKKVEAEKKGGQQNVHLKGLIAGAIVILGAGLAAWLLTSGDATSSPLQKTDRGLIKEVAPKLPPKSAAQLEKEAHPGMVKVRGKWYPEYNKRGGKIWVTGNWVRYHTPNVYTNFSNVAKKSRVSRLFDNQVDRDIAHLLDTPLGATVIGDWKYDGHFVRQFLKSLETPIIVTQDDDEWSASMKRAVNEAKIELKARHDAGEDIGKIMTDSRKELQKLGIYKQEIQGLINEAMRGVKKGDAKGAKILYDSANEMLAKKGIQPFPLPSVFRRKLEMEAKGATK